MCFAKHILYFLHEIQQTRIGKIPPYFNNLVNSNFLLDCE